jgi:hypothetical protein
MRTLDCFSRRSARASSIFQGLQVQTLKPASVGLAPVALVGTIGIPAGEPLPSWHTVSERSSPSRLALHIRPVAPHERKNFVASVVQPVCGVPAVIVSSHFPLRNAVRDSIAKFSYRHYKSPLRILAAGTEIDTFYSPQHVLCPRIIRRLFPFDKPVVVSGGSNSSVRRAAVGVYKTEQL